MAKGCLHFFHGLSGLSYCFLQTFEGAWVYNLQKIWVFWTTNASARDTTLKDMFFDNGLHLHVCKFSKNFEHVRLFFNMHYLIFAHSAHANIRRRYSWVRTLKPKYMYVKIRWGFPGITWEISDLTFPYMRTLYNVYITNQHQTIFALKGGGIFVPITSKNSDSGKC